MSAVRAGRRPDPVLAMLLTGASAIANRGSQRRHPRGPERDRRSGTERSRSGTAGCDNTTPSLLVPTGLAVGLALKEIALRRKNPAIRPPERYSLLLGPPLREHLALPNSAGCYVGAAAYITTSSDAARCKTVLSQRVAQVDRDGSAQAPHPAPRTPHPAPRGPQARAPQPRTNFGNSVPTSGTRSPRFATSLAPRANFGNLVPTCGTRLPRFRSGRPRSPQTCRFGAGTAAQRADLALVADLGYAAGMVGAPGDR